MFRLPDGRPARVVVGRIGRAPGAGLPASAATGSSRVSGSSDDDALSAAQRLAADGVDAADVPQPMSPDVANHVAAVTLFGTPSHKFTDTVGAPPVVIGPLYQPKTIELCADGDTIATKEAHAAHSGDHRRDLSEPAARSVMAEPLRHAVNPREESHADLNKFLREASLCPSLAA